MQSIANQQPIDTDIKKRAEQIQEQHDSDIVHKNGKGKQHNQKIF